MSKPKQRTKGNVKPSSSARAAELISTGGFDAPNTIGFVGFEAFNDADESADLDSDFRVVLRKAVKRDAVTRIKALKELEELINTKDEKSFLTALSCWPKLYTKLVLDGDFKVRESAHYALKAFAIKAGRLLGPYVKALFPAWLLGQHDSYASTATAALDAFETAFASGKRTQVFVVCKEEIVKYDTDILLGKNQTHSSTSSTEENVDERAARLCSCALMSLKTLVLSLQAQEDLAATYRLLSELLLDNAHFWKTFSNYKVLLVRSAFFQLLCALCEKCPELCQTYADRLVPAIVNNLEEMHPTNSRYVYDALLLCMKSIENFWALVNFQKAFMPKLVAVTRKCFSGSACLLAPTLLPILSRFPVEQLEYGFAKLLGALVEGCVHCQEQRESAAMHQAFVDCVQFVVLRTDSVELQNQIFSEHVWTVYSVICETPNASVDAQRIVAQFLVNLHSLCHKKASLTGACEKFFVSLKQTMKVQLEVGRSVAVLAEFLLHFDWRNLPQLQTFAVDTCQIALERYENEQNDRLTYLDLFCQVFCEMQQVAPDLLARTHAHIVCKLNTFLHAPNLQPTEAALLVKAWFATLEQPNEHADHTELLLQMFQDDVDVHTQLIVLSRLETERRKHPWMNGFLQSAAFERVFMNLFNRLLSQPQVLLAEALPLLNRLLSLTNNAPLFSRNVVLGMAALLSNRLHETASNTDQLATCLQFLVQLSILVLDCYKDLVRLDAGQQLICVWFKVWCTCQHYVEDETIKCLEGAWKGGVAAWVREITCDTVTKDAMQYKGLLCLLAAQVKDAVLSAEDTSQLDVLCAAVLSLWDCVQLPVAECVTLTQFVCLFMFQTDHNDEHSPFDVKGNYELCLSPILDGMLLPDPAFSSFCADVDHAATSKETVRCVKAALFQENLLLRFLKQLDYSNVQNRECYAAVLASGCVAMAALGCTTALQSVCDVGSQFDCLNPFAQDLYMRSVVLASETEHITGVEEVRERTLAHLREKSALRGGIYTLAFDRYANSLVLPFAPKICFDTLFNEYAQGLSGSSNLQLSQVQTLAVLARYAENPISALEQVFGGERADWHWMVLVVGCWARLNTARQAVFERWMDVRNAYSDKILSNGDSSRLLDESFYLNLSLLNFLEHCVQDMGSLSDDKRDYLLCTLITFAQSVAGTSDLATAKGGLFAHRVCQMFVAIARLADAHRNTTDASLKQFETEWREFFVTGAVTVLAPVFIKHANALMNTTSGGSCLDHIIIHSLATCVRYANRQQLLDMKLSRLLAPEMDSFGYPEDIQTIILRLLPLARSNVVGVQCTAYKLLSLFLPDLKQYELKARNEDVGDGSSDGWQKVERDQEREIPWCILETMQMCYVQLSTKIFDDALVNDPVHLAAVRGYFIMWKLFLSYAEQLEFEDRPKYCAFLRSAKVLDQFIITLFCVLPESLAPSDKLQDTFLNDPLASDASYTERKFLEHLACHLYGQLLRTFPALVRSWFNNQDRKVASMIESFTVKYVSPLLCAEDIQKVNTAALKPGDTMKIQVRPAAREVVAVYSKAELSMELTVQLPANHPLGAINVESEKRVGVAKEQWRKWVLNLVVFLMHQNGSLLDGLLLWKANVDKHLEGVEECMICMMAVHGSNYQLPRITCRQCKKKFHPACLYKWFSTSNNSTCPLCRSVF